MVKILLVDDHAIIRTALKIIVKDVVSNCKVDEAHDGNSAFEKVKACAYSLIILDVSMPKTDSFGLVSNILALRPEIKILMFSINPEEIYAKRYLQIGAKGYIAKDASEAEIRKAITSVLNDKLYISQRVVDQITAEAFGKKATNPFDKLSSREFEIVQHLARGEGVSQISEDLHLSSSTISTHKTRIFEKLGVSNIVQINELAKLFHVEV